MITDHRWYYTQVCKDPLNLNYQDVEHAQNKSSIYACNQLAAPPQHTDIVPHLIIEGIMISL